MTPKDDKKIPGPVKSIKIVFGTPMSKELKVFNGAQVSFKSAGRDTGKTYDLLFELLREASKFHESRTKRISKPPGFWIWSIADIMCSSNTMKRVVEPSIADMQCEYFEALHANRTFKAFCVRCRGYGSILMTLGVYRIVKLLWDMWQNTLAK